MKRRKAPAFTMLLAFCLVLCCSCIRLDYNLNIPDAYAAEKSGGDTVRTVVKLSANNGIEAATQKKLNEMYISLDNLKRGFTLDLKGLPDKEILKIEEALRENDSYYEINWEKTTSQFGTVITINPTYKISHEILYALRTGDKTSFSYKASVVYSMIERIIGEIITEGMTDYQKELAVHNYLVSSTEYDEGAAKLLATPEGMQKMHDSYTPYGVLVNKKGICNGYTETMIIFMRFLDIECEGVTGIADGGKHIWNRVKLDGEYYHVDITWDNPVPNRPGEVSYAYLNLTDEMILKDHSFEVKEGRECVSDKYNYFRLNNLVVRNQRDFERVVGNALKSGAKHVEMKLNGFDFNTASFNFTSAIKRVGKIGFSENKKQSTVRVYFE